MKNYNKKWLLSLLIFSSLIIFVSVYYNYKTINLTVYKFIIIYFLFQSSLLLGYIFVEKIRLSDSVIRRIKQDEIEVLIYLIWMFIIMAFIFMPIINYYVGYLIAGISTGIYIALKFKQPEG